MNSNQILFDVKAEIDSATEKHGPLNSAHEAYAVILEELQEFWVEVMKKRANRDKKAMRAELVRVAAMACRTIADLNLA